MKLKRIFIHGFKSFANPTTLEISDGITAIVGPNGSGKSNILDAIRWVVGGHSLKNLRADEKYDLIFSGSEKYPPARRAFVEMVFDDDGEELSVAREITREGKSGFYINGSPVRLKDIKDLFAGTGVGKDFYSTIAQGQVDRIVTSSSKELRNLFEEAAGTAFYREKKRETLQKLETVENNLNTLSNILYEREKMVKSTYLKAKRAERYLEYSKRLEEITKTFYGNLLMREREKKSVLEDEIEKSNTRLREIRKELVEVESTWSTLRQRVEEMDEKIRSFTKMLEEYDKRRNHLSDLKNIYQKRLSDLEGRYIEVSTRINSMEGEKKRLEKRKEEISVIMRSLSEELEKEKEIVENLEREKEEIASKFSESEKQALKTKEEMARIEREIMKLESEKQRLLDSVEDFQNKLVLIEKQISQKSERVESLRSEIEEMMRSIEEVSEKEKELREELEAIRSRKKELSAEKERILEEMNSMLRKKNELLGEMRSIERQLESYEGYSKAVREIFLRRDEFEGLHDVVANIVDVDEEHEKAIGALLGGSAQNVVVRDADVAKEIIAFLKEKGIGRATFLPLDLIEGHFSPIPEVERHPGFVGYALDLVRVPNGFEKLPSYLFGSDIVVGTMEDAIEIKRRYRIRSRIATLDGEIISGRGAISGGASRKEEPLIGRRIRLRKIKEEISRLDHQISTVEGRIDDIDEEMKELRNQEGIVEMEISDVVSKGKSTKRVLEELVKSSKELEEEISNLEKLRRDYETKISGMRARLGRIDEEVQEKSKRMKELGEKVGKFSKEMEKYRRRLDEINSRVIEETVKLGEIREKLGGYEKEMEEIRSRLGEIEENLSKMKGDLKKLEENISSVKDMLDETERELETLSKEYEDLFGSVSGQHEDKGKILEEMKEVEKKMEELKEEREKVKDLIHSLEMDLQNTLMKISRYLENVPEDVKVERLSDEDLSQIETEMKDLQNKIKYLGPVDLDAINEYEKLQEEYRDLKERKEDLEQAKKKLENIMKETEEEAKRRFMETFEKVNEKFSEYIRELFFGGEGYIKMAGDDVFESDLEILIRKPGRRSQKLQLLSGGEKALVAIALLFSFLQVNPSPFYVLDEVDGPLDDYNAERFADFLKKSSKDAQFLVITHNKIVMESTDVLHGITMSDGASIVIPVELSSIT